MDYIDVLQMRAQEFDKTLLTLKEIYSKAETWTLQRQILSVIVSDRSFSEVKQVNIKKNKNEKPQKQKLEMFVKHIPL